MAEHSHRHFSHECLCVGLAFAGDDEAGAEEGVIEVDQVQHTVDAGVYGGPEAGQEGSGQTAGGTGTGQGRYIHARSHLKGIGLREHTFFQHLDILRGRTLLRRKHPGGAMGAHKRGLYIA